MSVIEGLKVTVGSFACGVFWYECSSDLNKKGWILLERLSTEFTRFVLGLEIDIAAVEEPYFFLFISRMACTTIISGSCLN